VDDPELSKKVTAKAQFPWNLSWSFSLWYTYSNINHTFAYTNVTLRVMFISN